MNNYDYPIGADNNNAPWNEQESIIKTVTVKAFIEIEQEIDVYNNGSINDQVKEAAEAIASNVDGTLEDWDWY